MYLYPLILIAPASAAAHSHIQKKGFGTIMKELVVSNEEMKDIVKVVKSLKDTGLSREGFTQEI